MVSKLLPLVFGLTPNVYTSARVPTWAQHERAVYDVMTPNLVVCAYSPTTTTLSIRPPAIEATFHWYMLCSYRLVRCDLHVNARRWTYDVLGIYREWGSVKVGSYEVGGAAGPLRTSFFLTT